MNKLRKCMRWQILSMAAFIIALIANGCNQDQVVTPSQADNVDLSSTSVIAQDGNGGVLVITDVKLLLKDIKLNVADGGETEKNFKVGPFVVHLDLTTSVNLITSAYIPAGMYDKVKFEIHRLEASEIPPDPDFVDDQGRYSVVVRGTYNGIAFIFKSGVSAHQKLSFQKSLAVSADGSKSNITLQVKPYLWFIDNTSVVLDPTLETNLSIISNNIKENINQNIKIIVDNDKNGVPD